MSDSEVDVVDVGVGNVIKSTYCVRPLEDMVDWGGFGCLGEETPVKSR